MLTGAFPSRVVTLSLASVCAWTAICGAQQPAARSYEIIDRHALAAPPRVEQNLDQLTVYLVRPARNERDKVRAVFRWITDRVAYDVAAFLQGQYGDLRPEAVLQRRSAVCSGYTALFEAMARRAGIETATIGGFAKGYGYQAGLGAQGPGHAWNAVKIEGRWQLLDVTWGAGHVQGTQFVKRFKELHFLTPPEQMIFTHFPTDPRWQLLQTPLTLQQFESLPTVDDDLFGMGVPAKTVWKMLQTPGFPGFVKTYAHDGPLTVVAAPLSGYVRAGQECQFIVEAPLATQMALIHNGQWIPLQRRGRHFSGTIRPQAGELRLAQQCQSAEQYQVVLQYGVSAGY